jgi:CheY-like chemotaxis protein
MKMRILIVEDDEDFTLTLRSIVKGLTGAPEVEIARSRDSAIYALQHQFFDLILLDLKIPPTDGYLTPDAEHGHAVFTKSQELAPGTPVFVLTASPAEDFLDKLLARHERVDLWGSNEKFDIINFVPKWRLNEVAARLQPMAAAVQSVLDVELDRIRATTLSEGEDRLLRIFTARRNGAKCSLALLSGGLSRSRVFRLIISGESGAIRDFAVGKVGHLREVEQEADLYDRHISRLEPGATPRRLETIRYGARDLAGVFYGLAEGYDRTLFEAVIAKDAQLASATEAVSRFGSRWRDGVPWAKMDIGSIRRRLLSDSSVRNIFLQYNLTWADEFEARSVSVKWCCIHGDLHGANVLVDSRCTPVLIDYGDVGEGPASLDPICAELSCSFHTDGAFVGSDWPSLVQARKWGSIDEYVVGCPNADYVRLCRGWANAVSAGPREIAASAYSYLLRQLKYEDTDKKLVLALLSGVYDFFKLT